MYKINAKTDKKYRNLVNKKIAAIGLRFQDGLLFMVVQ